VETLLVGDDLGFIHMYNFYDVNWHYCFYKDFRRLKLLPYAVDEDEDGVDKKRKGPKNKQENILKKHKIELKPRTNAEE